MESDGGQKKKQRSYEEYCSKHFNIKKVQRFPRHGIQIELVRKLNPKKGKGAFEKCVVKAKKLVKRKKLPTAAIIIKGNGNV